MRSVGGELALTAEGFVKAGDHIIKGASEAAEFVVGEVEI